MPSSLVSAKAEVRYSFTAQFLRGAAIFATRANAIEETADVSPSDGPMVEHRAFVVGAILQSAAALESEISEVIVHGPGHHLGSNALDPVARQFLSPMADVIDRSQTLRRYELVLHLLRKPKLSRGHEPYQSADLLVKLRNELVHYKSKWGSLMDREKLFARLENLRFARPKFVPQSTIFFPHRCLNASLASWTVMVSVAFIDGFYRQIGIVSPLAAHAVHLSVPLRPRV